MDQVRNRSVEMPQELHTEPDTTIPTTVSSEPSTTSTESPTIDSGAATELATSNNTSPVLNDANTNGSSTNNAKTYPKRSRHPVERYEPTW